MSLTGKKKSANDIFHGALCVCRVIIGRVLVILQHFLFSRVCGISISKQFNLLPRGDGKTKSNSMNKSRSSNPNFPKYVNGNQSKETSFSCVNARKLVSLKTCKLDALEMLKAGEMFFSNHPNRDCFHQIDMLC